ncbi:hypothetical protein CERZMDRAFT_53343, partial [Cercospora zeae-maydis SCOH1-5]
LRYIARILDARLEFNRRSVLVNRFTDAEYASNRSNSKLISSYVFTISDTAVS